MRWKRSEAYLPGRQSCLISDVEAHLGEFKSKLTNDLKESRNANLSVCLLNSHYHTLTSGGTDNNDYVW
jgi:hypothetical protein